MVFIASQLFPLPPPLPSSPHTPNPKMLRLRTLEPLANSPGDATGSSLEFPIALGVTPAGTEAKAEGGGPGATLKKEDGEDDAEAGSEGGLDNKVGETLIPLPTEREKRVSLVCLDSGDMWMLKSAGGAGLGRTFSLSRSSEAGRSVFRWMISEVVAVIVFCSGDGN